MRSDITATLSKRRLSEGPGPHKIEFGALLRSFKRARKKFGDQHVRNTALMHARPHGIPSVRHTVFRLQVSRTGAGRTSAARETSDQDDFKIRKQRNTHQTSIAGLAEDQAGIAGLNRERRYVVSINRFLANTETAKPSSNR